MEINTLFGGTTVDSPLPDLELCTGTKKKVIQPNSLKDPKLEELKLFLIDWINATLKQEHIVVKSLEEDLFDGLVLHHLLKTFGNIELNVEEIALTNNTQQRKLGIVLKAVSQCLQLTPEDQLKWSVELIHGRDLLATLHLLVAIGKHFQPDLALPPNVYVEVLELELSSNLCYFMQAVLPQGLKIAFKEILSCIVLLFLEPDVFDDLFELVPDKINTVKQAILHFVNKHLTNLGLSVKDMDTQFADGVILLLLIGQLQGFFIHLGEFHLNPDTNSQMLQNITLALDLLKESKLLQYPVKPEDILNKDVKATIRALHSLFSKYKN
nr:PREDICTED: gamma-parvin [Latimeria chalumnae]|eukprot:XP_014353241.1 PREDICTED: gamma-parvin [Latimeria chalumnae]